MSVIDCTPETVVNTVCQNYRISVWTVIVPTLELSVNSSVVSSTGTGVNLLEVSLNLATKVSPSVMRDVYNRT
jgi:hypothetical protein